MFVTMISTFLFLLVAFDFLGPITLLVLEVEVLALAAVAREDAARRAADVTAAVGLEGARVVDEHFSLLTFDLDAGVYFAVGLFGFGVLLVEGCGNDVAIFITAPAPFLSGLGALFPALDGFECALRGA